MTKPKTRAVKALNRLAGMFKVTKNMRQQKVGNFKYVLKSFQPKHHNLRREMKDKKHKRWCSKHQHVHTEDTNYWSCRFPNNKELNEKKKEWRKNPDSLIDT